MTSRVCVCCVLQEEARADSYRYAVQPQTDKGHEAGGKKKKKKDNLDDLKQELEMVRTHVPTAVSTSTASCSKLYVYSAAKDHNYRKHGFALMLHTDCRLAACSGQQQAVIALISHKHIPAF